MEKPQTTQFQAVLLFDDACVLCNSAVRFLLARDGGQIGLLPLNSPLGRQVAESIGLNPDNPTSFALLTAQGATFGAKGVLQTVALLPGWVWVRYIPSAPLEPLYAFVAHRRYWLTRGRSCPVPTPAQRARLVRPENQPKWLERLDRGI